MEIFVFKTNISNNNCVMDLKPSLDVHPNILKWNVDLEDVDRVLRIVAQNVPARELASLVGDAGYSCEELN